MPTSPSASRPQHACPNPEHRTPTALLDHAGKQDSQKRQPLLLSELSTRWPGERIGIHFAPGPSQTSLTASAGVQKAFPRHRKLRIDWYDVGVLLLLLSSAAASAIGLIGATP